MAGAIGRWAIILICFVTLMGGCAFAPADGEETACELAPGSFAPTVEEPIASTAEELSALSCKMSTDTGYKSGKAFKIKVVHVDSKPAEWKTANAYMQMAKAAAKDGVQIRVVSGFRTMAEQKYLYSCYVNCSCNSCNLAAVPGTSNHQSGHALDLNTKSPGVLSWLNKHGGKFGFKRTVPSEDWHWEWWGEDDGRGPCNADTLKASVTHKGSSAKKHRGKGAHFVACAGDKFKLALTFRNKGSAVWRDVKKRGESIGSDVFLVTANGKKDKLTGHKRFSVRDNDNAKVRGDHAAKECSHKDGCRRTVFEMAAKAPAKTGIYKSRWRLRDYSKVWGKSAKGFGPKAEVKVKVLSCEQSSKECGCRVWCNDGHSEKLTAAAITSDASCKSVGTTFCKPGSLVSSSYTKCAAPQPTGTGGTSGGATGGATGGGTGGTSGGATGGASSGGAGAASGGATGGETGGGTGGAADESGDETDDASDGWTIETIEPNSDQDEPDDEDYEDDGFDGDADAPDASGADEADGCSVAAPGGARESGLLALGLVLGAALLVRRRRFRVSLAKLSGAAVGIAALGMLGCSVDVEPGESLGIAQLEVSAPKKAYCTISVQGHGKMDLEKDYLPRVITCENGGANLEALKAQAIAARSVAYYSMATSGSICDSQGCQVMSCGVGPSELAKRAVRETAGMYLSYKGTLVYGFYVAGDSGASPPGCKDYSGSTSHYVTYNGGKTGNAVERTTLGGYGYQNRGCMSQWGARCLDNKKDFSFMKILRFYYGSDINVVKAKGPCVEEELTLKAKLTRKWSSLPRSRSKKADYVACAGDKFKVAFSFKNMGTAIWRDVKGGSAKIGQDVFLTTASGKTDKLTGKKRFSLRQNENSVVRGDRKGKDCKKPGCRKTTFISGGMHAKAPTKPGIYTTRWRLRDYGKPWKSSKGFGPKAELKIRVVSCDLPKDACGCKVTCSDGKSHKLSASISSDSMCKSVGQTFCKPAAYVGHSYEKCDAPEPTGGTGGTGGTSSGGAGAGSGGAGAGSGGTGGSTSEPTAGAGGTSGAGGSSGDMYDPEDPTADPEDPTNEWIDGEDDEDVIEPEDDPDFEDDGFDGDAEAAGEPVEAGCSLVPAPREGGLGWLALTAVAALVVRSRRRRR